MAFCVWLFTKNNVLRFIHVVEHAVFPLLFSCGRNDTHIGTHTLPWAGRVSSVQDSHSCLYFFLVFFISFRSVSGLCIMFYFSGCSFFHYNNKCCLNYSWQNQSFILRLVLFCELVLHPHPPINFKTILLYSRKIIIGIIVGIIFYLLFLIWERLTLFKIQV